jgi:hypothetical protein
VFSDWLDGLSGQLGAKSERRAAAAHAERRRRQLGDCGEQAAALVEPRDAERVQVCVAQVRQLGEAQVVESEDRREVGQAQGG